MTPARFASYIRYKTKTNTTTLPDADLLVLANVVKDDIAKAVTEANEDYFGMMFKRNLEVGKRGYSFPTDILNQIKYLQAIIGGKQRVLEQFDVNSYKRPTDEDEIRRVWAGKNPQFDVFGSSLYIYSEDAIENVTDGLLLWAIIYPADLTSLSSAVTDMSVAPTNTSFGMPRQLHKVWADKVVVEYKLSRDKPIPLTKTDQEVDVQLALAINALKGFDLNRSIVATVSKPFGDGQDL